MSGFRLSIAERVGTIVLAAALGLALYVGDHGQPGATAIHFGWSGAPDRWTDRHGVAWIILATALTGTALVAIVGFAARRASAGLSRRRGLQVAQGVLIAVFGLLCLLHLPAAIPLDAATAALIPPVILSLVLVSAGAFLGRVPPNRLVGVRTPWSRVSRLAWDRSNRLAGRLMLLVGLGGLVAAALWPASYLMRAILIALCAAMAASVFESWRVWRTDPDRDPTGV